MLVRACNRILMSSILPCGTAKCHSYLYGRAKLRRSKAACAIEIRFVTDKAQVKIISYCGLAKDRPPAGPPATCPGMLEWPGMLPCIAWSDHLLATSASCPIRSARLYASLLYDFAIKS